MGGWVRLSWVAAMGLLFTSCPPPPKLCEAISCGTSEACSETTGKCEPLPACGVGQACDAGACIDSVCSTCDANIVCTAGYTSCDGLTGRCGTCRSSADCSAPTPVCAGAAGCAECVSDSDCPSAAPRCGVTRKCGVCATDAECASGQRCHGGRCAERCLSQTSCTGATPACNAYGCEQCATSADCAATEACYWGACHPAPAGETCPTAIALPFSSGSVLAQGTFLPYAFEDFPNSSQTTDVFFQLEVTQESALNLDLTLDGAFPRGGASIHAACGGDALASGTELRDVFVVPGTYWIRVVEDFASSSFTLRIWTTSASRAEGSHCLKPVRLTLDSSGHVSVTGDTRGLAAVGASACNTAVAKVVYDVEVPVRSHLGATLHPLEASFDPSLDVKLSCLGSLRQCIGGTPGADRFAQLNEVEPGHVTVQVSERNGTSGSYQLSVDVSPWATNDSCQTAAPLSFDGGFASARGLEHSTGGPCTCFELSCNGGRQLWRLSTVGQGTRSLQVRLIPETGNAAGLSLITQCDPSGSTNAVLACDGLSTAARRLIDVPALPEGDYFVEVGASGARFSLEAELGPAFPPPANDACAGAGTAVLDLSSGSATAGGDTRGADFDTATSCNGFSDPGEGRDVVFQVQAGQRGRAAVTVTPDTSSFDPVLHVRGTCTSGSSSDPCTNDGGLGGQETLAFDLTGTPKFLWVKGAHASSGSFQLQANFTPGPANDSCAAATVMTIPQTLTGSTVGAFHDFNQCDYLPSGPDAFYRFTYTASNNGTVNVTLTPTGFDARLFVLSTSCTATSCTRMVNDAGVGLPETLALPVARNLTYFLGVDGDQGGTFTLSLQ